MKKSVMVAMLVLVVCLFGSGCASTGYQQNQSMINQGAVQGAIGAAIGLVAANNINGLKDNRAEVVAIATGLGLANGAFNGRQQDQNRSAIGAANEMASTVVINVNNSNGSMTPVVIRRVGNQYVGPRGEYYNALPTEQQLKSYGF